MEEESKLAVKLHAIGSESSDHCRTSQLQLCKLTFTLSGFVLNFHQPKLWLSSASSGFGIFSYVSSSYNLRDQERGVAMRIHGTVHIEIAELVRPPVCVFILEL